MWDIFHVFFRVWKIKSKRKELEQKSNKQSINQSASNEDMCYSLWKRKTIASFIPLSFS